MNFQFQFKMMIDDLVKTAHDNLEKISVIFISSKLSEKNNRNIKVLSQEKVFCLGWNNLSVK